MNRPRTRTALGVGIAIVLASGAGAVFSRTPSLERDWDEDVRILTPVAWQADGAIELAAVRDWRYTPDAVTSKTYTPARYLPADVQGLWMYEQPLGLGGRIAHTFLVFEFPESYAPHEWLGLSVETRREVGETYSIVRGVLRGFEVTHIWATEEDLVRRRVEHLNYPLVRYPVTVPQDAIARVFEQFAQETHELASTPRWYNTLLTNCTSSLIQYVNEAEPGAIPWDLSFILTGRADDHLGTLGYVDLDKAEQITREWLDQYPVRSPSSDP
ncbi:MAG: DUF4105 domain-containing protein [Gemmatimonadota bacterium]